MWGLMRTHSRGGMIGEGVRGAWGLGMLSYSMSVSSDSMTCRERAQPDPFDMRYGTAWN